LSISLPVQIDKGIAAAIGRHALQLQEFRIYQDKEDHEDDINMVAAEGPFPLLNALTITSHTTSETPPEESVGQIYAFYVPLLILSNAPSMGFSPWAGTPTAKWTC
jgi:hypothetical protein